MMRKTIEIFSLLGIFLLGSATCGAAPKKENDEKPQKEEVVYVPGNSYLDAWKVVRKIRISQKVGLYVFLHQIGFELISQLFTHLSKVHNSSFFLMLCSGFSGAVSIAYMRSLLGNRLIDTKFYNLEKYLLEGIIFLVFLWVLFLDSMPWLGVFLRLGLLFIMICIPSQKGENPYGPNPLSKRVPSTNGFETAADEVLGEEKKAAIAGNSYWDAWKIKNNMRISQKVCLYGILHQVVFEFIYGLSIQWSSQKAPSVLVKIPVIASIIWSMLYAVRTLDNRILDTQWHSYNLYIMILFVGFAAGLADYFLDNLWWVASLFRLGVLVIAMLLPSQKGTNPYGPNPLSVD